MKIFKSLSDYNRPDVPVVLTTGTFDGVHKGHRVILNRLNQAALESGGESLLITFWPHPRLVLNPGQEDLRLLNTMSEKQELLQEARLNNLLMLPFSKEFAALDKNTFIEEILVNTIGVSRMVVGYDHRFGKNREGSFNDLVDASEKYGFEVEEIPSQEVENSTVSSTRIRKALMEGDVAKAAKYLGYHYFISGKVVTGKKIGKKMGFPTANIEVAEKYKLIPANGVYAARIQHRGQIYGGMVNIGVRPTFEGKTQSIEAHLFDFDSDIYEEPIRIHLAGRIRDEIQFSGKQTLQEQLGKDETSARNILKQVI